MIGILNHIRANTITAMLPWRTLRAFVDALATMAVLIRCAGDIAATAVPAIGHRIAAHVAAAGGSTVLGITPRDDDIFGIWLGFDIDVAVC